MELWLDTHSLATIQRAKAMGFWQGVTTNPSIVAASGRPLRELLEDLLRIQTGPVAVQVVAEKAPDMLQQAKALWAFSQRILVKVPVTEEGLICISKLTDAGIPVLATAVFESQQALFAFKAGASYIAPYVGRIRDQGVDPWSVLQHIIDIKRHYGFQCKILGAGFRTKEDFSGCTSLGVCAATIPEKIFDSLLQQSPALTKTLDEFKKGVGPSVFC